MLELKQKIEMLTPSLLNCPLTATEIIAITRA